MITNVILLRGLPGSGKSRLAKTLRDNSMPPTIVCSADDYHVDPQTKEYCFDPKNIGRAHALCFRKYANLVHLHCPGSRESDGLVVLLVDNTNLAAYELSPYVQMANAYTIPHEIRTLWCDPVVAAKRNVHGVPATVVMGMYARLLEERLPAFWNHTILLPED